MCSFGYFEIRLIAAGLKLNKTAVAAELASRPVRQAFFEQTYTGHSVSVTHSPLSAEYYDECFKFHATALVFVSVPHQIHESRALLHRVTKKRAMDRVTILLV